MGLAHVTEACEFLIIGDASIFPSLMTTSINCAVMMAAEKAAELLLG